MQTNGLLGIDTRLSKKICSKLLSNSSFVKQIFQGKILIVNRNSLWKSDFFFQQKGFFWVRDYYIEIDDGVEKVRILKYLVL